MDLLSQDIKAFGPSYDLLRDLQTIALTINSDDATPALKTKQAKKFHSAITSSGASVNDAQRTAFTKMTAQILGHHGSLFRLKPYAVILDTIFQKLRTNIPGFHGSNLPLLMEFVTPEEAPNYHGVMSEQSAEERLSQVAGGSYFWRTGHNGHLYLSNSNATGTTFVHKQISKSNGMGTTLDLSVPSQLLLKPVESPEVLEFMDLLQQGDYYHGTMWSGHANSLLSKGEWLLYTDSSNKLACSYKDQKGACTQLELSIAADGSGLIVTKDHDLDGSMPPRDIHLVFKTAEEMAEYLNIGKARMKSGD